MRKEPNSLYAQTSLGFTSPVRIYSRSKKCFLLTTTFTDIEQRGSECYSNVCPWRCDKACPKPAIALHEACLNYVDLHTHILPGLDDGSPDMSTSLAMIEGLLNIGFSTICATPHQKTNQYLPSLEAISAAHQSTVKEVAKREWPVKIPLGAENMWDSTLCQRIQDREIPCYDQNPAFLMEFVPNRLPMGLFERIFELRLKGLLPVIAHPERYAPLWKSEELQAKLAEDCAMVVDLGALSGHHGRKQAKCARKMVLSGIAHAAASDLHSPEGLSEVKAGIAWIHKKAGSECLERLLSTHPAMIVEGRHPQG